LGDIDVAKSALIVTLHTAYSLGYIAIPAKRGQLSCSQSGMQAKPTQKARYY